jgi:hypothetical protein
MTSPPATADYAQGRMSVSAALETLLRLARAMTEANLAKPNRRIAETAAHGP